MGAAGSAYCAEPTANQLPGWQLTGWCTSGFRLTAESSSHCVLHLCLGSLQLGCVVLLGNSWGIGASLSVNATLSISKCKDNNTTENTNVTQRESWPSF
jgi:hypothetical protein